MPKEDAIYVVYNVCADYFEERSGDKYKRAQLLNNAFYEGLYTMDEEEQERVANTNYPDMEKSVKEVMLEAIFNKYFTLDRDLMYSDGMIASNAIEGEYQAGEVDAIERWQRKTESYVHEKCGLTDADLKILQIVISSLLKGLYMRKLIIL